MPELPEVERSRSLAASVAAGRTIRQVTCASDSIVLDRVSPARLRRALRDRRVIDVHRRGKHLWFQLDRRPWPCFHLGMTGAFRTPAAKPLRLASSPAETNEPWPPRFGKLHLRLDDGAELVFVNKRRLGRIRLRDDPAAEPPISELGFDPLLDMPPASDFAAQLRRRSARIKMVLLDQSFAAGVGNWIADEVLYQARIDPRRRACRLSEAEVRRVRAKLLHVVRKAVDVQADKRRFPRTWLFHRRWGRVADAVTVDGEAIAHITIGGRTTAWVPARQR